VIPDAELDQIRSDAQQLLQGSCSILAKQSISDGGGGHTESWEPVAESVACRIAPVGGGVKDTERNNGVGHRVSDETTHIVTLPAGTDIDKTSRIDVDGSGLYEVTLIRTRTFDEFTRRVEVKEVDA
jgi:Phage head-tail joining protein